MKDEKRREKEREREKKERWRKKRRNTGLQLGTTSTILAHVAVISLYRIYRYVDPFCIDVYIRFSTLYARGSHGNTGNLASGPHGTPSTSSIDASQLVDPNWSTIEVI